MFSDIGYYFGDDTTDDTGDGSTSILDSLSQLVDISSKAADIKNKLAGQKTVGTPTTIVRPASTGMSTTTWIMIGVAGLLALGTGVYLFTKKG
jgi:hypothetical protein